MYFHLYRFCAGLGSFRHKFGTASSGDCCRGTFRESRAGPIVRFTTVFGKIGTEKDNERSHCSFRCRFVRLAALKRHLTCHDPAARKTLAGRVLKSGPKTRKPDQKRTSAPNEPPPRRVEPPRHAKLAGRRPKTIASYSALYVLSSSTCVGLRYGRLRYT